MCSVETFCGVVKLMDKQFPNRLAGPELNNLVDLLDQIEAMFAACKVAEPKPKKSRKVGGGTATTGAKHEATPKEPHRTGAAGQ